MLQSRDSKVAKPLQRVEIEKLGVGSDGFNEVGLADWRFIRIDMVIV
ncbi:hypothetical protein HMPREF3034_00064 [Prevotella sp. DNF00663]|nr:MULTISPECIES: hypothetical protein [unclassified Prevotella]KXB86012.1 hypothetical protein HMPREF3034_00064 [Prevotella sp. DNF00663]